VVAKTSPALTSPGKISKLNGVLDPTREPSLGFLEALAVLERADGCDDATADVEGVVVDEAGRLAHHLDGPFFDTGAKILDRSATQLVVRHLNVQPRSSFQLTSGKQLAPQREPDRAR
jgi:hypothetical protein